MPATPPRASPLQQNSLARLAAVQALYQQAHLGGNAQDAYESFMAHGLQHSDPDAGDICERPPVHAVFNQDLLHQILCAADQHAPYIQELITRNLSTGWTFDRIELVLRCILRAGVAEFLMKKDLAAAILINEYVNITWSFYEGKEPHFVNSMMDKVARRLGLRMKDDSPKTQLQQPDIKNEDSVPQWHDEGNLPT